MRAANGRSRRVVIPTPDSCTMGDHTMAKGNNARGNKEIKKPKKEKPKVSATSNSLAGKLSAPPAGKKGK
jgi:hypothetical protein